MWLWPETALLLKLLHAGELTCVWSGRPLRANTLDVDHCFPWSAWPCDHLWNLLPTHKEVNQKQKRDRLPFADHLREAEKRITSWWTNEYSLEPNESLTDRFFAEAESALPWLGAAVVSTSKTSLRASKSNACACTTISKFRSGREDGRSAF
jgi:hypothetical protein